MKRRQNKFIIVAIAFMGLLFILNLIIDNPYTHSFANYYLNEKILNKLPIHAKYQSMKIELLPPSINIYGVNVTTDTKKGRETELVSVSTVTFKVSLWSIFMAQPQMGDLELKDLNLMWPPPPEFMIALKGLGGQSDKVSDAPPIWPPSIPPPLSSLTISNGSINASFPGLSINSNQDPHEVTRVAAEGLNLEMKIHDWKSFTFDLNSSQTSITDLTSSYIENGDFKMRGEMVGNSFNTRIFDLKSSRINFTGKTGIEIIRKTDSNIISDIGINILAEDLRADLSVVGSFLDLPGCRGTITGQATTTLKIPVTSKSPLSYSTIGKVKSADARFFDFRLYESEAELDVDLDKIQFKNTKIMLGDQSVAKGNGYILFDKAVTYDFTLAPEGLPFKDLLGIFNVDFDVVNFNLTSPSLRISGIGDPFLMSVVSAASLGHFTTPSLNYDHSRHSESPQCDLDLDLRVNSKELSIVNGAGLCHIVGRDTRPGKFSLALSGFAGFDTKKGMNINLASDAFNPAPLTYFSQASLEGTGTMSTVISGPYDNVKVDINTALSETIIGSTPVGSVKASLRIDGEQVTWNKFDILTYNGGTLTSGQGRIQLNDNLDSDFTLSGNGLDHGIVGSAIRDITDGTSSVEFALKHIEGKLNGPLMTPLRWQGNLDVEVEAARDHDYSYAQLIKGTITGNADGYSTDNLKAHIGGSNVELTLRHKWDRSQLSQKFMGGLGFSETDLFEVSGKIAAIPGAGDYVRLIPAIGVLAAENGISSEISGDMKLAGTLGKQTGIVRLNLVRSKLLKASMSDISSTIIVDGTKVDIMAEQGGSAVKARVNLDFGRPEIPFNWYITAKNADFRPWLPTYMSLDARNYAYVSATWNLKGTLEHWWESVGELALKDLRLRFYSPSAKSAQRLDFRTAHASKFFFTGKSWVLEGDQPLTVTSSLGELQVGLKNHRPPADIGLTLAGKLDVAALRFFLADVETATGTIMMQGSITGPIENPNMNVAVKNSETNGVPSNITIGLSKFRPSFQNINLDAKVTLPGIIINKLSSTKGNGTITTQGFLARPGTGEDSDLTINFDNAAFLYPFPIVKYFDSSIDGQIKINGSGQPWNAAGRVSIRKARSNREVDIREAILESLSSKSTAESLESTLPVMNLDISLVADKSIGFSSRTGQAQLSTDLHIGGTDISPSILGLIDISKGRFLYKRNFEIGRGLVNFDDPIVADPSLDISAVSDVSSYRVSIGITGRASAPKIDFTVDPATRPNGVPISKMEIIGLLSRGSLPEGGTQNTSESAAAAEALNLLAGQVEDTVQRIFDLSGQNVIRQVYIDTYADSEGTPIARFNLPLNITEDFGVILKVDQTTVKVSSEYSLHDSISLTGGIESTNEQNATTSKATGVPADTGVDLKFKFSFE
jgi:TamB, inner membrane protein subunit of TAM complex